VTTKKREPLDFDVRVGLPRPRVAALKSLPERRCVICRQMFRPWRDTQGICTRDH